MSAKPSLLEHLLRRDRLLVVATLLAVTSTSWLFLLAGAGTGMSTPGMTDLELALGGGMRMAMSMAAWTPAYAVIMFFMWWIMMVAMMLPSAAPAILIFARVHHKQRERGQAHAPASVFAVGYLVAWGVFSAVATGAQWLLESAGLLGMMMASTRNWLGGGLLLVAGLWQFTPWKQACLHYCRSPLAVIMSGWREGYWGALRMGWSQGLYCLGCCWFLMGLLFFGGIMNLYWIGGLALYVLLEKTVPAYHAMSYGVGVALTVWGMWLLLA